MLLKSFGYDIKYDLTASTSFGTNLRSFNLMRNILDATNLPNSSTNYKNQRFYLGSYGFYNTIINKAYIVDFTDTGSYMTANACFNV
jgi:hypothetical protein